MDDADQPASLYPTTSKSDGELLFRHACALSLEGIVAKRKGTRYTSGRCGIWMKIKNSD